MTKDNRSENFGEVRGEDVNTQIFRSSLQSLMVPMDC